jgi:hypothetical protein
MIYARYDSISEFQTRDLIFSFFDRNPPRFPKTHQVRNPPRFPKTHHISLFPMRLSPKIHKSEGVNENVNTTSMIY